MKNVIKLCGALFVVGMCTSCASIITGPTDDVKIESTPSGANYETNTGHRGVTPATIQISDSINLSVRVWMDGYQSANGTLESKMSMWFLGNIVFGGIIGIIVDLATGNYQTHSDSILIQLAPIAAPKATGGLN